MAIIVCHAQHFKLHTGTLKQSPNSQAKKKKKKSEAHLIICSRPQSKIEPLPLGFKPSSICLQS